MSSSDLSPARAVPGFWSFAAAHPSRIAVVDHDGRAVTFGDALATVNRMSHGLRALGLRAGDTVAILLPNRLVHLEMAMAAAQTGVELVPVNIHLTASETAYILGDCAPALVVHDTSTQALAAAAVAVAEMPPGRTVDVDAWVEELGGAPTGPPDDRSGGSTMVYTSGTSGRPKGVRRPPAAGLPEDTIVPGYGYLLQRFGIDLASEVGTGVHLVTSPLYHGAPGGFAKLALHLGHTVVVPGRFDAARTLDLIEEHRVTWMMLVPTMFKRLLDLPAEVRAGRDLSSLRWVFHGAAACPPELKRSMLEWWGPVIHEFYASTEGGGTSIGPEEWLAHAPSVGRPWPGAEVRILDDAECDVPVGEVGTIYFRSTRPFAYHNDPEKTAASHSSDGRYVTAGDLGHLDADGYLHLASRRSDLIISGGVNVYPAEVEAVFLGSAQVADVAVVGVDDPEWGQAVVAVVQPADPDGDPRALVEHLQGMAERDLASYKRPKRFTIASDISRTPTGKIRREVLLARLRSSGPDPSPSS